MSYDLSFIRILCIIILVRLPTTIQFDGISIVSIDPAPTMNSLPNFFSMVITDKSY